MGAKGTGGSPLLQAAAGDGFEPHPAPGLPLAVAAPPGIVPAKPTLTERLLVCRPRARGWAQRLGAAKPRAGLGTGDGRATEGCACRSGRPAPAGSTNGEGWEWAGLASGRLPLPAQPQAMP